ncbi:unnamed protein product [Effrenium voratum]|nr:unnamed protein product [Effrenium voratum]
MSAQEGGALKLVTDPDLTLTDEDCVTATYDRTLVDPLTLTMQNAGTTYAGTTDMARDINKLMYNGGDVGNSITVIKAGFISVCYCARPVADNPGVCAHDQWVLVNRLTIRGPGPGQSWTVSTNVVFRIEYNGWGLAKDDQLRIIPATSDCSDVNGNPRAAWGVTNIKVGCPDPCSEVGEINDVLNGDISVGVLSADTYMCDNQNTDCRTNDIKAVTVIDDQTTELEFEGLACTSLVLLVDGCRYTLRSQALHLAAKEGHVEMAELLLRLRADVNARDKEWRTPVSLACQRGHLEVVELLAEAKGDLVAADEGRATPYDWATAGLSFLGPQYESLPQLRSAVESSINPRAFQVLYISNRRGKWQRHSKVARAKTEDMNYAAGLGDVETAKHWFRLLQADELLRNSTFLWNTMLKAFANAGDFDAALAHFQQMQEARVEVNSKTFGKLMEAAAKRGDNDASERVFNSLVQSAKSWKPKNKEDKQVKLNILIDASAKAGDPDRAKYWFDQLGDLANEQSFGSLLNAYASCSKADAAIECLRQMQTRMKPNAACFAAAVTACGRNGDVQRALGLVHQLDRSKVPMTEEDKNLIYNSVINAYSKSDNLAGAERWLRGRSAVLTQEMYNTLIDAAGLYAVQQQLSFLKSFRLGLEQSKLQRDVVVFSSCIHAAAVARDAALARSLLREMVQEQLRPNARTVQSLQSVLPTAEIQRCMRIDMKVCWKYTPAMGESGPVPRHVAQVGTLTLLDPNSMSDCLVSLTSLVKKQTTPYAPLIISFRTATAETGKRYESLEGRMRLRIYFVRTVALKATFTDGATIEENQGEDELVEARQYICGKLFREVWSSDDQLGFPMPRGCYYRTYGQTQELNVLFDRKNGLAPGKYYQVVLSGVAMDEAMRNGEYVHIFTTDDVDVNPYISLERGVAPLYRSPQDAAYGSQGVKFAETEGVKISSGSGTEMLELKGGTELRLTLRGDPLGGGISASAILRLYLWPLTQWNVANACTVSCIPHDQVSAPCGAVQDCKGDAIIPNFQQNYLRIVLPSAMATMTEFVSHTLVFPDLVLPPGGFFSTRLAAQISKPDDTKPHYTESSGDYLYKMPDEGVGVGKLVEFYGDGDQRPFRGDMQNVLYASIVLPATLFAAVQTADAYLTLTLPSGYSCVRTPDVNGDSPWRAEDTLGVFQDAIPQGTGSPDEGSGTRGWSVTDNHCVYTLRQNAVVYAGSSLYIRVTVNNPEQALQRMDPANRWQVTMTSKGYHQYFVSFPPVIFNTIIANFSSNTAVLGKIEQPLIVPSNWMFSEGGVVMSQGYLNIFFRSEQGTGVMASVHVEAPPGFTFTPNPCEVSDLEDMYYATPGQMGSPTHRLPGFVSCEHRMYPYNHAAIKLTGAILANSYYAFGLWCSNAEARA